MLNSNEEWKDILGFEGLYQASNLGRIKSLERLNVRGYELKEKILKPGLVCGYYQVSLYKNSKVKHLYGRTSEKENIIAFYGDETNNRPFIKAYFQDNE